MTSFVSYLHQFSGSFKAALIIWPFLSMLLTLPILAYLYHRDGKLKVGSALAAYISVLYIAGLGCFTLYPLPSGTEGPGITYGIPPQFNPLNFLNDINKEGIKAVFQLLFNIALFMPLGFIARCFLKWNLPMTIAVSFGTSLLIETAQLTGLFGIYPFAYRTFEVDDIITNTLGGLIGWLVAGIALNLGASSQPEANESPGIASVIDANGEPVSEPISNAGSQPISQDLTLNRHPGLLHRFVSLWIDFSLISMLGLLTWACSSVCIWLFLENVANVPDSYIGDISAALLILWMLVAFAVVEIIVPWHHQGSTLGGIFTHMSVESKKRSPHMRALFYSLRTLTLILLWIFPLVLAPILLIFYLVKKEMPYDMVR